MHIFIAGVKDTGDKLFSGVNDTGERASYKTADDVAGWNLRLRTRNLRHPGLPSQKGEPVQGQGFLCLPLQVGYKIFKNLIELKRANSCDYDRPSRSDRPWSVI